MLLFTKSFVSFFNFDRVEINRLETLFFITWWNNIINRIRKFVKVVNPCLSNNSLQSIRQLLTHLRCYMFVKTTCMLLKQLAHLICLVCNLLSITCYILRLIISHTPNEIRDGVLKRWIVIRCLYLLFMSGRLECFLFVLRI